MGDVYTREGALLPILSQETQDRDVAALAGVQVPGNQDALGHESEPLERPQRAGVVGVRIRADALQLEKSERERQHEGLGLRVRAGAPVRLAEPGPYDGPAVTLRE